jgi:hypothetical protein
MVKEISLEGYAGRLVLVACECSELYGSKADAMVKVVRCESRE